MASTASTRSRSATCSRTGRACPTCRADTFDLDKISDREFIRSTLVDAEPFAKPGRMLAYHAVSGGYILGEIVHQVTGKDIRTVLAETILDPLGFRWTDTAWPRPTWTRWAPTT